MGISSSRSAGMVLRVPVLLAVVALIIVAALGLLLARHYSLPLAVDRWWMHVIGSIHTPPLDGIALVLNAIGAGVVGRFLVPLAIVILLLAGRDIGEAFYFLVATVSCNAVVDILKGLVARDRPPGGLVATASDAFPSGHSATAAVMTVALALILRRVWFWMLAAAYLLCMMASRTYLGVHWLTDVIAGALLGAALAVLLYAALDWYARVWWPRRYGRGGTVTG